jgi:hypothetical protein
MTNPHDAPTLHRPLPLSLREATRRRIVTDLWELLEREAADLAAAESAREAATALLTAVRTVAEGHAWIRKTHTVERASQYRPRGYCTYCHERHPCDPLALLEALEAALVPVPLALDG